MAEGRGRARRTASSGSARRTISGRWARPGRAGRARRFITISDRSAEPARDELSRTIPANASSRSGTWCSCSTIAMRSGKMNAAAAAVDRYRHGPGAHRRGDARRAVELRYGSDQADHPQGAASCSARPYGDRPAHRHGAAHQRGSRACDGVSDSTTACCRRTRAAATCCARSCGARCAMRGWPASTDPYLYKLTGFVAEHDARRLSGDDGERRARGARGEGRRASLRDDVPGGRESSSRTRPKRRGRRAARRRRRSSSTTPTGWRSMSRKRWRGSPG